MAEASDANQDQPTATAWAETIGISAERPKIAPLLSEGLPRWVPAAAFLLILLLIFDDPAGSGSTAGGFAEFLGQLLRAVGEFVIGLLGGSSNPPTPDPNLIVPGSDAPELYTGHAVDLDGDGRGDLLLFGDPTSPTLHELPDQPLWNQIDSSTIVGALVTTLLGLLALGVQHWAKRRWPLVSK